MVGKHLDDPAVRHITTATFLHHAFQLSFHRTKPGKFRPYPLKMFPGDGVYLFTRLVGLIREGQQLPDIIQTKTKLATVADEHQA